ncbi:P-loop containing nucleoside triphosphate hydrolase protein [Wallemia mellicola]|uniref:P-loop containing nucleoside triphosphate hydrolase protein n=1 Tax=Wallemia mellicola TaxID=1708541 RepID=A0AB38MY88_9BASI|nr:P-loop containing nucleoside triphosphate hydrolase protein [Wallemia mellicola]TIC65583.1 P-loop containing nucleoside triphosphate hydrolase protein [Wallemia mellicola]
MFAIEKTHTRITKHKFDVLSISKLTLICIQIGSMASVLHYNFFDNSNGTASYSLQLVSSIILLPLSYAQHTRAYAPSTLISAHLAVTSLFSATQLRSFVNAGLDTEKFFAGYCVFFASTCCLFFAELIEKRWLMKSAMKPKAKETTSSIPSRIMFTFLYPVLYIGFKKSLSLDDVNDFGLPEELSSNDATKRFTKLLYGSQSETKDGKRTQPILMPSILAFYDFFFAAVIPKLLYVAVTFAQPFLVSTMLAFIDSYADENAVPQDPNVGWGLVGAYTIVYLSLAATTALYWDKVYAMVIRYRAALVSVLFDKSVRLASSVAENQGKGSAVTYMSVDVERVVEGVIFFHECWAAIVSIACAAVILWFKATYAMIPPLCVMIGFFGVTSIVGKKVSGAQKRWMGSTESRLAVIGSVMKQIVPTKLLGLEPVMPTWINPLRNQEVEHLRAFYRRLVVVVVLSSATINCAGLSALGTFAGISGDIRPQTLFTIYTVVQLVTLPISTVGHCFPLLVASWASMKRIAGFLVLEEKPVSMGGELPTSSNSSTDTLKCSTEKGDSLYEKSEKPMKDVDVPPSLWNVNASASSENESKTIIKDIDISFPLNKLSIVVGPVGSGKSILLKTLLGETHIKTGTRKTPGGTSAKISYAPQEAFIWPTTVKENIILDGDYDYEWYNKVIESCALEYDFKRMSKGDLTQLTEKGGVSGGQKQRISLARALYASRNCSFVVLDDCFSALDAHTTKHVFEALFGSKGLLKRQTVVMVTHSHKHLTAADFVVAMESGSILAQGTLRDLYKNVIDIKNYIGDIPKELEEDNEIVEIKPETEEEQILELQDAALVEKPGHVRKSVDGKKYDLVDEEDPDEEDAGANLGWTPYKFYMRHCGWARLSVCVFFLILYNAIEVGLQTQIYLEKWSSANTTDHRPWLGGYAGFTVAAFLTSFCMMWMYTQYTAPRASLGMHEKMLENVLEAPVTYFQKTSSALLINRWGSDIFISDFAFPISMLDVSLTAVYVVGAAILILIAVPWLAIAVPVLAVIYWSLQKVYLATSRQLQRLTISSKTPLYTSFSTLLTGLVTIRAFKSTAMFKDLSEWHLNRSQTPMYYRDSGIRFLRTFLNLVTAFIAIGIACIAVGLRNTTSAGYLGVALSQLVSMATSLTNLLLAWTRVENGVVSLERIVEITQLESEEDAHRRDAEENERVLVETKEPAASWPESGHVEYKDVTLRYNSGSRNALDHLNIHLPAGHKLGICGRTGSGKSSTIYALLRGQPLTEGSIIIDGVDLATVPLHTLRSRISTISQDPFLLHASISENLTLGCPEGTNDEDIWQALRDVGMEKQVDELEKKLETQVTTDGTEFSAGERQLLCIARVLLQKRKIVILDEASSSMDGKTDVRLLNLLKTALKGITVISVAHRISTISEYNQVIVMDEGRVLESDSPATLLRKSDSEFYKLAHSQGMLDN